MLLLIEIRFLSAIESSRTATRDPQGIEKMNATPPSVSAR
jgi:hypothetical protein